MSLHGDLDSTAAREELFAVADLVHNLPYALLHWGERPWTDALCDDEAVARAWLERELSDIATCETPRFDPSAGPLRWTAVSVGRPS